MNLQLFADHTLDLDLLPERPLVVDIGCRWWDFAKAVLERRPLASIAAYDPDPAMEEPDDARIEFYRAAVVGGNRARSLYASYSTGEGNFLFDHMPASGELMIPFCNWQVPGAAITTVGCIPIAALKGQHWDAIKLDCEGSEFEILENWPGPIATQISVEFHDFTGPRSQGRDAYYQKLWERLPWYKVVRHELSRKGEGIGHWDTVLALKEV